MKTKLTLTVHRKALANAKRYSRKTGKSISRMFEEIFEGNEMGALHSESQKAAERLLRLLKGSETLKTQNDKQFLKKHVAPEICMIFS
jgi:hypothetical protein